MRAPLSVEMQVGLLLCGQLNRLGVAPGAIGVAAGGAPAWPDGIVGSIAHTDAAAASAVAHTRHYASMGLDIEHLDALDTDLIDRVCTPAELEACPEHWSRKRCATLLFSAKESVYKCFLPRVQRVVEFLEISIRIRADEHRYDVYATQHALAACVRGIEGGFAVDERLVYTSAWIPAVDSTEGHPGR